jgi:endoglucanase
MIDNLISLQNNYQIFEFIMKLFNLFTFLLLIPFFVSCSDSENNEEPVSELKLVSVTPADGATEVSPDITEIVLTYSEDVSVKPIGLMTITLNDKIIKDDITCSGKQVIIALSNVAQSTTYKLYVPANAVIRAGSLASSTGAAAVNITFTTGKRRLDITPDVTADSNGMTSDAIAWTHKIYAGWNLGNSFESLGANWDESTGSWTNTWVADRNDWETGWGNPKTTQEMILAVKNAGFNAIRIPVRWYPHITDQSTMEIDSRWLSRVKEVVDYCINNGMYVIINTHHELWMENHPFDSEASEISKKEILLWKNIASYFRDYDEHLAFSGTNEVNVNWQEPTTENQRVQNGFNQDFIKAVRQTGGRNWYRNLIVQTYSTNPEWGIKWFETPTDVVDNRLIVEYHYYAPYDYCSGSYYYWGKAYEQYGTISPTSQESSITHLFGLLSENWHSQGLGIIMGESGVTYHVSGNDQEHQIENMKYYLTTVFSTAKSMGIAPFVWDNNAFGNGSEMFGIFDRNDNMNVRVPAFLEGIMDGAKTAYPN